MGMPNSFETLGKAPQKRLGVDVISGRLIIHSCPRALTSHVEWALDQYLAGNKSLTWNPQPAEPGSLRTEFDWVGEYDQASKMISCLQRIGRIRAEVLTHPHDDSLGERFLLTPILGIHRAVMDSAGEIVMGEQRIRQMIFDCANELRNRPTSITPRPLEWESNLTRRLDQLSGTKWDEELDVFRSAAYGAEVRWLINAG
jgi:hypothetical protein